MCLMGIAISTAPPHPPASARMLWSETRGLPQCGVCARHPPTAPHPAPLPGSRRRAASLTHQDGPTAAVPAPFFRHPCRPSGLPPPDHRVPVPWVAFGQRCADNSGVVGALLDGYPAAQHIQSTFRSAASPHCSRRGATHIVYRCQDNTQTRQLQAVQA